MQTMQEGRICLRATIPEIQQWLRELVAVLAPKPAHSPTWVVDRCRPGGLPGALPAEQPQQVWGVYRTRPEQKPSQDQPLLTLVMTPIYPQMLQLDIYPAADFPLSAKQIVYDLTTHFRRARPLAEDAPAYQAHPGRVGAPPLACNLWLEEQLRRQENPRRYHHLYKPWLEQYYALRGFYPAEPRRSFRAAVASCLGRLRRAQDQ